MVNSKKRFNFDRVLKADRLILIERCYELMVFESLLSDRFANLDQYRECVKYARMSQQHFLKEVKRIFSSTDKLQAERLYESIKQSILITKARELLTKTN